MKHRFSAFASTFFVVASVVAAAPPANKAKNEEPASFSIDVRPSALSPGDAASVRLVLTPAPGIKINKYPRIKLKIPASPGLVEESEGSVGADAPPPPDRLEENYFKSVDPLETTVRIAEDARSGRHEVDAKLSYFYCVSASGYCAPARVAVKIPIEVR